MNDRKVNFSLVQRSDKEGMSITFGWWRAEVVKHLGKFSYFLDHLESSCLHFLNDRLRNRIYCHDKVEGGNKIPLVYSQLIFATDMHLVQIFQFLLENSNEILASLAGFISI